MNVFEEILKARGITGGARKLFLAPVYDGGHDPFLLPDMQAAVDRLVEARHRQEHIAIYGDYDIDGLSATALLDDAFASFGFNHVVSFIPNRFSEGYGLTRAAVEKLAAEGSTLIVTVDTGSLSHKEVDRANELGVDVIITDHHNVAASLPRAAAIVNPKRAESRYPFTDLAAVGVAFKLVQALQTRLDGLSHGQEKWLLDLVALGTVCDAVTLLDENRAYVHWGLKVIANTRRPGLKALMAVAGVAPESITARSLGFGLGPRMNAAGRLETAQYALDMLQSQEVRVALEMAQKLDELNTARRSDQDRIYKSAIVQADMLSGDPVLVVSDPAWSHGIIGIVAAKLLEKYKKPTFVIQELGEESKGSARSYGAFSAADAITAAADIIIKGGGHKFAAGVTLPTENIPTFRQRVNEYYRSLNLFNQPALLLPTADTSVTELGDLSEQLLAQIQQLEPFGNGNPEPIFMASNLRVVKLQQMGSEAQHAKIELGDVNGRVMQFLAFNAPEHFFVQPGDEVNVWFSLIKNDWRGKSSLEGRLMHLELSN